MNKTVSKKNISKTICDSVNHTRLPKEVLLPDWVRWDNQGKKGDRVDLASIEYLAVCVPEPVWMRGEMKVCYLPGIETGLLGSW